MTDILLLTHESDFALDRVISWLHRQAPDLSIERVNREQLEPLGQYSATIEPVGWNLHNIPRVVWLRQLLPERDPFGPSPSAKQIDDILICRRQWLAWTHLFNNVDVQWLNDPANVVTAESKVRQLAVAANCGFVVPRTLLTNNHAEAMSFTSQTGPCIVKSLTTAFWEFSDQSFVFTTTAEQALAVDASEWTEQPVFVQERVQGTHEGRLLAIGNAVVGACRRRSTVDWRTDPTITWTRWHPTTEIINRALSYLGHFGLHYGAFDFILDDRHENAPVFLECNPAGEFGFLDDLLDKQPSSLLGELLVSLAR